MDHRQPIKMRLRMITGTPTGKQPTLTFRQARQVLWRCDSQHRAYGSGWTAQTQQVLERLLFMIAKNPDRTIPSTNWLAETLRISRRSVVNHINRLVQHGLLQKHERHAVWEDTLTRQSVRVRTSNQYTPGKTLLGWLRDLVAGGGVVQESGGKTDQKYINKIRSGLTRQAEIALAWMNRKRELELDWISDHRQRWLPLPDLSG
jgi:biotin operon repressor